MAPENAATVMACVLERAGHINSAGGYLRDLTRRAERGEFGIGSMLMALARTNSPRGRQDEASRFACRTQLLWLMNVTEMKAEIASDWGILTFRSWG